MTILKIRITRIKDNAGTHYYYPPTYDASKIQVLCYESTLPENIKIINDRGGTDEFLLGVVEDTDAPEFLESLGTEIITENQALELGSKWTKQVAKITSSDIVIKILTKINLALINNQPVKLTQEEKNAINSDNKEIGVNKSRSFSEILKAVLAHK